MDYTEKVIRRINGYRGVIVDVDADGGGAARPRRQCARAGAAQGRS